MYCIYDFARNIIDGIFFLLKMYKVKNFISNFVMKIFRNLSRILLRSVFTNACSAQLRKTQKFRYNRRIKDKSSI